MKTNKKTANKAAVKPVAKPATVKVAAPEPVKVHPDDLLMFGKVVRPSSDAGDVVYVATIDEIPCRVTQVDRELGWRYYPHVVGDPKHLVDSFEFATKELARDALEAETQARLARAVRQAGGRVTWAAATV